MVRYFTGFFTLMCFHCFSQSYNFVDSHIPVDWQGDVGHFEIDTADQLHLIAPVGQTSSTLVWGNTQNQNASWEFYVGYSFAASTTNYALFYLESIESNLASTSNCAYYLKIGGATGNTDKIELIYQNGASKTIILQSRVGLVGSSIVSCRIRVTKTVSGLWELYVDATGGQSLVKDAEGSHVSTAIFQYGGLRCVYSSTRRDKFYFDDIFKRNLFAATSYKFENDSTLTIFFSERLLNTIVPVVTTDINIPYLSHVQDSSVCLRFDTPVAEGTYLATLALVFSTSNDSILSTTIIVVKTPIYYTGQVRITELMSDPSPSYSLPEVEWVELKNTSRTNIDLAHFSISDPTSKVALPHMVLLPGAVIVITTVNGCNGMPLGNCIEMASLPSLNNSSDSLFLWANDTLLVDYVYFTLTDLPKDFRADGGYSIIRESMPKDCMFSNKLNFSEGVMGASPGAAEDVPIEDGSTFTFSMKQPNEIVLVCTGNIDWLDILSPILVDSVFRGEISTFTTFTIMLQQDIEEGEMFQLQIDSITTCRNQKRKIDIVFDVVNPKTISKDDVFVNEVLYNPFSGGLDFVEFYNTTDKYIQLQHTHIFNQSNGKTLQHVFISNECVIEPLSFKVFTADTAKLKQHYDNAIIENCIQFENFITMDDAGGALFFVGATSDTLDIVHYNDDYHNPLLRETEGVSIEKINPAANSFFAQNWTSSAVSCTPGYANSQLFTSITSIHKTFYCDPCHVTTNINGVTDFVLLHLIETKPGFIVTIRIYTLSGEKVVDIVENHIVANENEFIWNGQKQNGSALEDGIYLAVAEWWSVEGRSSKAKIPISTSQY